jgi:hypothetical protein
MPTHITFTDLRGNTYTRERGSVSTSCVDGIYFVNEFKVDKKMYDGITALLMFVPISVKV